MDNEKITEEDIKEAQEIMDEEGYDNIWSLTFDSRKPGKDSWLHYAACLIITVAVAFIGGSFGYSLLGFIIALMVGFAKELIDKYVRKTKFDWKDIAWDIFGGTAGVIIAALFYIATH